MRNIEKENQEQLLNFCDNVRLLRRRAGLTKKEMAKRLGVGVGSISMLEKGVVPKRLSCEVLFRLALEFGVSPTDLLKKRLE